MKFFLVLCTLTCFVRSDVLPDRFSKLMCRRSDPNFTNCVKKIFEKEGPSLIENGIPELNFPSLDPLEVPLINVDRTYRDLFSIKATLKNAKAVGASNIAIEWMKVNPAKLRGQLRLRIPLIQIETDYDGAGQLLGIQLKNKGHFSGNFSNIQVVVKTSIKPTKKANGVAHFAVDKLLLKLSVGDGRIKLTADNPDSQIEADYIENFFNEDPAGTLEVLNPIITETVTDAVKIALTQVYNTIPAKELLPE